MPVRKPPTHRDNSTLTLANLYAGTTQVGTVRDELDHRFIEFKKLIGLAPSQSRFGGCAKAPVDLVSMQIKLKNIFVDLIDHADKRIEQNTYSMRHHPDELQRSYQEKVEKYSKDFEQLNNRAGYFSPENIREAMGHIHKACDIAFMQVSDRQAQMMANNQTLGVNKAHKNVASKEIVSEKRHSRDGSSSKASRRDKRNEISRLLWVKNASSMVVKPRNISAQMSLTFSLQLALLKSGAQTKDYVSYMSKTLENILFQNQSIKVVTEPEVRQLQRLKSLYDQSVLIRYRGETDDTKQRLQEKLTLQFTQLLKNGKSVLLPVSVPTNSGGGHAMLLYLCSLPASKVEGARGKRLLLMHYDSNGMARETQAQIAGLGSGTNQRILKQTFDVSRCLRSQNAERQLNKVEKFAKKIVELAQKNPRDFQHSLAVMIAEKGGKRLFDRSYVPRHAQKIGDCVTQSNHAFMQDFLGYDAYLKLESFDLLCARAELADIFTHSPEYLDGFIKQELAQPTPIDGTNREGLLGYEALSKARESGLELACSLIEKSVLQKVDLEKRHLKDRLEAHVPASMARRITKIQALRQQHGLIADFISLHNFLNHKTQDSALLKGIMVDYLDDLEKKILQGRSNFIAHALKAVDENIQKNNQLIAKLKD